MGKSKSKKYLKKKKEQETTTDTDTNTNTDTDTNTNKKNKKNNKNSGFIDNFIKLNNKTKTYLSIICMLLIFAGFIWYRQNKNKQSGGTQMVENINQTVNPIGNTIQQNLESVKETFSHVSQMSQVV